MNFIKDDLGRQKFADVLGKLATNLASAPICPAGRVIAVDAPWGSGKSWIARRLPDHFKNDSKVGACVYIDAFKFDYHQEPFVVVTSAILDCFTENTLEKSSLTRAAIDVLKTSLPVIGKGLIKVGAQAVGINADKVYEAIVDSAGDASEKVIEKSLAIFSVTKATTAAFQQKLESLTFKGENGAPLVVIIDELDRCRPSYALEMLERVKHLFDVPNVVFIFFIHTPALHSAIRKTYGYEIDSSEYLRKFISVTVNLPVSERASGSVSQQIDFLGKFVNTQYPMSASGSTQNEYDFRKVLITVASVFNASFRDLESAMLLSSLLKDVVARDYGCAAYCFMLKVKDPVRLNGLKSNNWNAFKLELDRLDQYEIKDDHTIEWIKRMFLHAVDRLNPESNRSQHSNLDNHEMRKQLEYFRQILISLELEHIKI